ncbi:MAG: solute-binding protein [Methanomicrobiales archaeon]|nr:solute-binding protein [Methanomicrobiales archaeon]
MLICCAVCITGCTDQQAQEPVAMSSSEPKQELHIATTTSLYDTGLLDHLKTGFEEQYGAEVKIISAGTGKALEYGEAGDVDVMMVHDRVREDLFIENGFGVNRRVVAYNFFVIVGPESDPASITGLSPEDAFTAIMEQGQTDPGVKFVSRGDESGTHAKEKAIWKSAGYTYDEVKASGDWYIEAGSGMGATLTLANEKEAYTISDIGTFLAYQGDIDSVILVEEGDILLNIYSAMQINPAKYPDVNSTLAKEWINYLITDEVQDEIENFRVAEFGRPLFFPSRGAWETIGVTQGECETPVS